MLSTTRNQFEMGGAHAPAADLAHYDALLAPLAGLARRQRQHRRHLHAGTQ